MTNVDVQVQNHGTLYVFIPCTDEARNWIEENVQIENHMRLGNNFACEWRFADAIVNGMREAGLVVA